MELTLEHPDGRTLQVVTGEAVSWQDDEYNVVGWKIDVYHTTETTPKTLVFHDEGWGSPPYDERHEEPVREWLECAGVFGRERAVSALNTQRILIECKQLATIDKITDSRLRVLELIQLADRSGPELFDDFANEVPFSPPGVLAALIQHAQALRFAQYELARLTKELAVIEARMESVDSIVPNSQVSTP